MLQLFQQVRSGKTELKEVPEPAIAPGRILVRTEASLISAGTERMLLDFTKKNLLEKARSRPDLVKQVLDKASREGWLATLRTVRNRLDSPLALGYSAAGVVDALGSGVSRFQVGQRVAIAGAGYANHAEFNCVPLNLVAPIPDSVSSEEAAYCTVCSIALQGLRVALPEIGEIVGVIGLGLIGLITAQLLKANGCLVIGIDPDDQKRELACSLGVDLALSPKSEDLAVAVEQFSLGRGLDRVIITASTKSNQPVEMAGKLLRQRGSVTVVGAVGMDIPRDVYYKKELDMRLSMSYGPGRYDFTYEEGGIDYPYPYVRWTENRNMEAVLNLIAQRRLQVAPLTTHRFAIQQALQAYQLIQDPSAAYVGVLLLCPQRSEARTSTIQLQPCSANGKDILGVSFIGAGNYASQFLLPLAKSHPRARLQGLVTATGLSARHRAEKFGFMYCSTQAEEVLRCPKTQAVFVATRHDSHSSYIRRCLEAGKDVFVEKPVAVNSSQLQAISEARALYPEGKIMVGLNRRFSPACLRLREVFAQRVPLQLLYRVNAGAIPPEAWLQAADQGGGMLVGEMCHFIDVALFLTGSRPVRVTASGLGGPSENNLSVSVAFADDSLLTLFYSTLGDKSVAKERLEVYGGGALGILDDYRTVETYVAGKRSVQRLALQDKGQKNMLNATLEWFCRGGVAPLAWSEIELGMRAIFATQESLRSGQEVRL